MSVPPLTILMSLESANEMVEAGHIPPMPDARPSTLRARNTLIGYATKRVEQGVISPLTKDTANLAAADEKLAKLRAHFLTHHITIGPLYMKEGSVCVDIDEVPR